jgi:hypothetical protein
MPIANEISAGFFLPKCRNTAMLPIMVIEMQIEQKCPPRAQAKVRGPPEPQKVWKAGFCGLDLPQPLGISQNGQRNLWKSLDKTGSNLEMFGEKAWSERLNSHQCAEKNG